MVFRTGKRYSAEWKLYSSKTGKYFDLARALYYSVAAPGEAALYQWYGSEGYWQIGDVKQGAAVAGF